MRHEMLTQRALFLPSRQYKKGHAESAFRDACRTSSAVRLCALPAPADHAHGLLTFIEHHKIRALCFASRQRQETAGIQIPKHPDAILCASQWVMVVRLVGLIESRILARALVLVCFPC